MKLLDYDGLEYYNGLIDNKYAPIASPSFTGTPTAPTPTAGDDSQKIATTAYVQAELEDYATLTDMAGYLPLSGGTMTGALYIDPDTTSGKGGVVGRTDSGIRLAAEAFGMSSAGAYIDLNGRNYSANAGTFTIAANSANGTKSLIGKTDGTLTWGGTSLSLNGHTHNYLPLTGGTIQNNNSITALINKTANITRGTTPSAGKEQWIIRGVDSAGNPTGGIYKYVTADNISSTRLYDYTNSANSGGGHYIGVFHAADGTGYTYAPTPASTDDSTKIATTAYVKDCVPKSIGSATKPVYTNSNGVVTACTYTLGKSVPSNAVFTDTDNISASSNAANGYIQFDNGLIIEWGNTTYSANPTTITFQKAFPNYCRSFVGIWYYAAADAGASKSATITSISRTSVKVIGSTTYTSLYWVAIGY